MVMIPSINSLASEKTALVAGDLVLIEDSASSYAKKKVTKSSWDIMRLAGTANLPAEYGDDFFDEVITVGPSGYDYTSIGAALAAKTAGVRTKILIYPNTGNAAYTEKVIVSNVDDVAFVGTDKTNCSVTYATEAGTFEIRHSQRVKLANLTILNTNSAAYNTQALRVGSATYGPCTGFEAVNCIFDSGRADTIVLENLATGARFVGCTIRGNYDLLSSYCTCTCVACTFDHNAAGSHEASLWTVGSCPTLLVNCVTNCTTHVINSYGDSRTIVDGLVSTNASTPVMALMTGGQEEVWYRNVTGVNITDGVTFYSATSSGTITKLPDADTYDFQSAESFNVYTPATGTSVLSATLGNRIAISYGNDGVGNLIRFNTPVELPRLDVSRVALKPIKSRQLCAIEADRIAYGQNVLVIPGGSYGGLNINNTTRNAVGSALQETADGVSLALSCGGAVVSVEVTTGGSYTSAPTAYVRDSYGHAGEDAVFEVVMDADTVASVNVVYGGTGYLGSSLSLGFYGDGSGAAATGAISNSSSYFEHVAQSDGWYGAPILSLGELHIRNYHVSEGTGVYTGRLCLGTGGIAIDGTFVQYGYNAPDTHTARITWGDTNKDFTFHYYNGSSWDNATLIINNLTLSGGSISFPTPSPYSSYIPLYLRDAGGGDVFLTINDVNGSPIDLVQVGWSCFPGWTPVTMADGSTKCIDEIVPGDAVMSVDLVTGQQCTAIVDELLTFEAARRETTLIHHAYGTLEPTVTQHLMVDGEWVYVRDLKEGMDLLAADGHSPIVELTRSVFDGAVHDLRLADGGPHVYFVGGALAYDWTYDAGSCAAIV